MAYRRDQLPSRKLKPLPEPIHKGTPLAPPEHACSIWAEPDGTLRLGIPGATPTAPGHSISLSSYALLYQILRDRAAEAAKHRVALLNSRSAPSQHLVNAMADALRSGRKITHAILSAETLSDDELEL